MADKKKVFLAKQTAKTGQKPKVIRLDEVKPAKAKPKKNKRRAGSFFSQEQKRQTGLWLAVILLMVFIVVSWSFIVRRNIEYLSQSQKPGQTVDVQQFKADWEKDLEKLKLKLNNLSEEIKANRNATSTASPASGIKAATGSSMVLPPGANQAASSSASSSETIKALKTKINELEKKLNN